MDDEYDLLLDRKKAVTIVENMAQDRLEEYIEKRLKGISVCPALNTHSDETPEYFLQKTYEVSKQKRFKSKFRKAIASLLKEEQDKLSDTDYVGTLLKLCERYIISEAVVSVSGMASIKRMKGIKSIHGDLYRCTLMALARMPEGLEMTDIWVKAISDSAYTAAAFAALREQGLEQICRYLPRFMQMYRTTPGCLNMSIAFTTLYDKFEKLEYSEEEITRCIINQFEDKDWEYGVALANILENIGKKVPENITQARPTPKEILREVKSKLMLLSTQKEGELKTYAASLWEKTAEFENKPDRKEKWAAIGKS